MLIKSQLITQMSGSVGGLTGSRNAGGMYLRGRGLPVNPNTSFQQTVRNAIGTLTNRWGGVLTASQRDAWQVYADAVPLVNSLGDARAVSGIAMYTRSNVSRIQAGLPIVDDAPTVFNLGTFTLPTLAVNAAADQGTVTFDDSDDWANEDDAAMLVYASRPFAPSINYFKGPYRYMFRIDGDGTTPPTSPANDALPFPVAIGNQVGFRVRVTRADGRLSSDAFFRVVAA